MVGVGWQVAVVGDGGRGQDVRNIHQCERLTRECWNKTVWQKDLRRSFCPGHQWPECPATGVQPRSTSEAPSLAGGRPATDDKITQGLKQYSLLIRPIRSYRLYLSSKKDKETLACRLVCLEIYSTL